MKLRSFGSAWRVDLRSLAAFRIALACLLLFDLGQRAGDVPALFGAAGLVPPEDLIGLELTRWPLAPWVAAGGTAAAWAALAIGFAAGVVLALGWRSRTAAVVAWLALVALQTRNPLVNFGGDTVLRMLLLLGAFLPLGARWAVGRATAPSDRAEAVAGPAVLALRAQLAVVMFVAGWAKLVSPDWQAGAGVLKAFDHELLAMPWAMSLHRWEFAAAVLGHTTILIELGVAVLLLWPARAWRLWTLAFVAAAMMFVSFGATLRVGLFPWVTLVGLLPFLPSELWNRIVAPRDSRDRPRATDSIVRSDWSVPGVAVLVVFLGYLGAWNVGLWYDAGYRPPAPLDAVGRLFHLEQRWGMFTRLPVTGWLVVHGRLRDGTPVDLFRDGGPVPSLRAASAKVPSEIRPEDVSGSFRNIRWRVVLLSMTEGPEQRDVIARLYARYLCRNWNARLDGSLELETLEIIFHHRQPRGSAAEPIEYGRAVLWEHGCFR